MNTDNNITNNTTIKTNEDGARHAEASEPERTVIIKSGGSGRVLAWSAAGVALASYILLLMTSGIIAMIVAACGLVLGFIAANKTKGALHRLAVTAIIASAVLVAVLAAFVLVIRLGLN